MPDGPASTTHQTHLAAGSDADPLTILLAQHREIEARFAGFEAAGAVRASGDARMAGAAPAGVQALLGYLEGSLEMHIRLEETLLFPPLRRAAAPWDADLIDQMLAGHDEIRRKRQALQAVVAAPPHEAAAGVERPTVEGAIADLGQAVHDHLQFEEELIFRLVPELLSPDTIAALGRTLVVVSRTTEEPAMTESERTPAQDRGEAPSQLRGETTGTPERPAREVAAPVLAFDLPAEIARLHQESGWIGGERDGKTLVKEPDFHIVLTAMKSGTRLAQHKAAARVSIQVLSGQLSVAVRGETRELAVGHLLVLERDVPHDVIALVDSAFLLTLAWPERREDALPRRRQ